MEAGVNRSPVSLKVSKINKTSLQLCLWLENILYIKALVSTSTNFSSQVTSESSCTGFYYPEASSGRQNILAHLLGVSVIINLGLIAIILLINICKLVYLKIHLAFYFSKLFYRFARKIAGGAVNALKQRFSALPFATAEDIVNINLLVFYFQFV